MNPCDLLQKSGVGPAAAPRRSGAPLARLGILFSTGMLMLLVSTRVDGQLLVYSSGPHSAESSRPSTELTVSPAQPPIPALKYRLLPRFAERKPGSAYPIYARLTAEESDRFKEYLNQSVNWLDQPLQEAASDECSRYLDGMQRVLQSLELASLRTRCDWEYPIGEENTLMMLLPDVNESRMLWRLQALQVRHLAASHRMEEAIQALQVGFAMSRHIEQAPFVVHDLVAISCANLMLLQVAEMIQQPGAPNLYWALASLPSPLVDIRESIELESDILQLSFPATAQLDRLQTSGEWRQLLEHLLQSQGDYLGQPLPIETPRDKIAYLVECHTKARRYFLKHDVYAVEQIDAMSLEELLVRWMMHPVAMVRDDLLKWSYVPYADGEQYCVSEQPAWKFDPDRSAFPDVLFADRLTLLNADARLRQRIAALQAVEALRMYAAAHDGTLPSQLDEVTTVPIPQDPLTGKAFLYDVDADGVGHLRSGHAGDYASDYRIRIRADGIEK